MFDLGQGHVVELIHLPGHTAGQSGFLDHKSGCFFIGDVTSAFGDNKEYPQFCTINSLRDAIQDFMPRIEEVSGLFPGHGTIDLHPKHFNILWIPPIVLLHIRIGMIQK